MTTPGVLIERDGDVATVTIQRPDRANALDSATARSIADAIEEAGDARAVILTGAGTAFCAGGDLEELERWSGGSPAAIGEQLYSSFQAMIRAIRASDAVVIAAINGAAVGAGLDLALACDLRVAAPGAKLGQVWVKLGVIPGTGGAWMTQALVGVGRAAELLLTGRLIDARTALDIGLVNAVTDDAVGGARALAAEILANPREGVIASKRAYVMATDAQVEAALEHAARVQGERFTSDEFKEALRRRSAGGCA